MFVVATVLLSLIGTAAGFTVGSLLGDPSQRTPHAPDVQAAASQSSTETPHSTPQDGDRTEEHDGADSEQHGSVAVKAVPIPPVLTTLAAPEGRWIRLEGSVLVQLETDESPELLAEKAGEQILTYLRTVRLEQISGPSGTLGLRNDLNEMVRAISNGQVQGVLIHGLLVE